MILTCVCNECGGREEVYVSREGYNRWVNGAPIQNALPNLSVDQRELLISSTCGKCFDKLCGMEDEEMEASL